MDFVRMYYNSIEVMPKILISHFLRYMGFYIEEITDGTEPSSKESSLDVYIVSEEDVKQNQGGIASVYKGILHKTTKNGLPTY